MPKTKRDTMRPALAADRDTNPRSRKPKDPQVPKLPSSIDCPPADETKGSYLERLKMARIHQRPVVKECSVVPTQSSTKRAIVAKSFTVHIELVDTKTRNVIGTPKIHVYLDPETGIIVEYSVSIRPQASAHEKARTGKAAGDRTVKRRQTGSDAGFLGWHSDDLSAVMHCDNAPMPCQGTRDIMRRLNIGIHDDSSTRLLMKSSCESLFRQIQRKYISDLPYALPPHSSQPTNNATPQAVPKQAYLNLSEVRALVASFIHAYYQRPIEGASKQRSPRP